MLIISNNRWTWSMFRYGLVFVTWGLVTWNYYMFSHFVHQPRHFKPSGDDPNHHGTDDHDHGHGHDHEHGRGGSFDNIHLKKDGLFLYGLALPLALLTVACLIWNPSTSPNHRSTQEAPVSKKEITQGDVNVKKWTIIWFLLPLLLIMLDGARGHDVFGPHSQEQHMGWNLYVRICMSLMSPSGYAACWALALFLKPVTKHSPILDWLRVTPVQAVAFHRVAGWTGFWNSVLHGFLHLRHLMDVLNPERVRPWYEQLKILLIPSSLKCYGTQNPWEVFWGRQDPLDGTDEEANQCWLALVNLTGMVSVLAYVLLAITSLPQVRRYSYALFYRVHIPSAWIMLITAIWHYPTCALVLIPNIIYYISFNIPIYVTQNIDNWGRQRNSKRRNSLSKSPLIEANLIEGGSIELIFATETKDNRRHESRFARLFCPSVSPLSHPFSIFSRHDLVNVGVEGAVNGDISSANLSILLRPTGPFTTKLTKALFPNHSNDERIAQELPIEDSEESFESISSPLIPTSTPCAINVDCYYAGSFDWVNRAMTSHDKILLVAGGVGIVPFLEFLPSLQHRIQIDTALAGTTGDASLVDSESLLESDTRAGPSKIHLHWYCREIGLASYVWNNYLQPHVEKAWEKDSACKDRLQIHLHLTSSNSIEGNEEILEGISGGGLVQKQSYSIQTQQENIRPVRDARLTQSLWSGLLVPGILIIFGTVLHWWWYKDFIIDEKFRHDNLIIRSHSILFTLLLALVVSIPMERYHRYCDNAMPAQIAPDTEDAIAELNVNSGTEPTVQDNATGNNRDPLLTVSSGRPLIEDVIGDIIDSRSPGVYSCGPLPLMDTVEDAIRRKRADCAFYREDSEM